MYQQLFDVKSFTMPRVVKKSDRITSYNVCYTKLLRVHNYNLEFENKKDLFDYIKKSGVSGDSSNLDFKNAKKLFKEYSLNYLEFEVTVINTVSKL